jgi:hypothetical protein
VRRARTTTGTGVLCARYMCPRTVETPGVCADRSGCHKLRTVPSLQASGAGAGGSPGACAMRAPAASPMEGTAPLLWGPRRTAVPDGHPRRDAVAQAGFPAVGQRGAAGAARARLAGSQRARGACWRAFCCVMWGVSTLSDEARAGMCASCRGNAIFEHTCRRRASVENSYSNTNVLVNTQVIPSGIKTHSSSSIAVGKIYLVRLRLGEASHAAKQHPRCSAQPRACACRRHELCEFCPLLSRAWPDSGFGVCSCSK